MGNALFQINLVNFKGKLSKMSFWKTFLDIRKSLWNQIQFEHFQLHILLSQLFQTIIWENENGISLMTFCDTFEKQKFKLINLE